MSHLFVPDPTMRVLIANRGEIARHVIRSASHLGIETVATYADPDASAPHVTEASRSERVGPAALNESYLSIEAILAAAQRSEATHVHPGYGFLSERSEFARAVTAAGLTWIGPAADTIDAMGSKINARAIAADAGVATIPGFNDSQDPIELREAASELGYPVLIKASAGGGGKGIRVVHHVDDFDMALSAASDEADRAFGDASVIVEKYITAPRHIEVQVAGDRYGKVIDLGTRECSVQRRYQKVLEEAPAPNLSAASDRNLRQDARTLAAAIDYDSIGTIEFILDAGTGAHYFLEMNTRIQVEHTVTEEVTGIDLVELQLALAAGTPMPVPSDAAERMAGAAVEARINAEDPWGGHIPQTGLIERIEIPAAEWIRWDGAIENGSEISSNYDSMIGKLIVTGADRSEALYRLDRALADLRIRGVTTNIDAHRWLLAQPEIRRGQVTTRFLDEVPLPRTNPFAGDARSPWSTRFARRIGPHRSVFAYDSAARDDRWQGSDGVDHGAPELRAPFPGLITEVMVGAGDQVEPGQILATIEAMKMLHPLSAGGSGTVASVEVEPGSQVGADQLLITFHPLPPETRASGVVQ